MMLFLVLKYLHVIGAAVLLGTGAGIAFFMLRAHLTEEPAVVAAVARIVVLACASGSKAQIVERLHRSPQQCSVTGR